METTERDETRCVVEKESRSGGCRLSARHDVRWWIDPSACGLAPDDLRCMTIAVVFRLANTRKNARGSHHDVGTVRFVIKRQCRRIRGVEACVLLFLEMQRHQARHPSRFNHQEHVMEAPKHPSHNPARVATVEICTLQGSTVCTALIRLDGRPNKLSKFSRVFSLLFATQANHYRSKRLSTE